MTKFDHYNNSLESITGSHFINGNKVEIFKNGIEIFPAMLQAIEEATVSIDFLTYVYWTGDIAEKFAKTLIKKAHEGLKIRVLLDAIGSRPMKKKWAKEMLAAGICVEYFRPVLGWPLRRINHRTHRKILICDKKIAFTGGAGIAKQWQGNAKNKDEWRETQFSFEGPIIKFFQGAFLENWLEATHNEIDLTQEIIKVKNYKKNIPILGLKICASLGYTDYMILSLALMEIAKKEVIIVSPYFNPPKLIIRKMQSLAKKGLKIKIMTSGKHSDARSSQLAGHTHYKKLLQAGIQIFHYDRSMLHAKIMLVDDTLASVGSANFNHRSMRKDEENNLVISDFDIVKKLQDHFEEDLKECQQIDINRWKNRGITQKILEKLVYPFRRNL